jgi:hypothetical protein
MVIFLILLSLILINHKNSGTHPITMIIYPIIYIQIVINYFTTFLIFDLLCLIVTIYLFDLYLHFGKTDMGDFIQRGPYTSGFTTYRSESGHEVAVFYPSTKTKYKTN